MLFLGILFGCTTEAKNESQNEENKKVDVVEVNVEEVEEKVLTLVNEKNYEEAFFVYRDSRLEENEEFYIVRSYLYTMKMYAEDQLYKNVYKELVTIPEEYDGFLAEDIQKARDYYEEQKEIYLQKYVTDLKNRNYENFNDYRQHDMFGNDPDFDALNSYSYFLEQDHNIDHLMNIPNPYSGVLSDEISYWRLVYSEEIAQKINGDSGNNANPSIGMTAEEVKNSRWGKPDDINRTITAYGVSEQWVYDIYGYVYLDDGIVTAIQD